MLSFWKSVSEAGARWGSPGALGWGSPGVQVEADRAGPKHPLDGRRPLIHPFGKLQVLLLSCPLVAPHSPQVADSKRYAA